MRVLAVSGPPEERRAAVELLASRLGEEGQVGTVTGRSTAPERTGTLARYRDAGASRRYAASEDGWIATGESLTLDDALEQLAPDCSYAIVEGYDDPALPTVVVGDREPTDGERNGEVLHRAPSSEQLAVETVVDALAECDPFETLHSLVARVKESADEDKAGAIATFTGRVRARDGDDDPPTEFLEFERYDEVAAEKTAQIREELEAREGVYEVLLHHRTGVVEAGVDIVFVVVLAGHRPEAFETVEDGINRLKAEVPLFKKEVTVDGTFWAHQHEHEHGHTH
jgi:molybdopterin synthase catalytic subunit